jgi:hypothetical protein
MMKAKVNQIFEKWNNKITIQNLLDFQEASTHKPLLYKYRNLDLKISHTFKSTSRGDQNLPSIKGTHSCWKGGSE